MRELKPISWRETSALIKADRQRLEESIAVYTGRRSRVALHPSFVCALLYRLSNHFYRRRRRFIARFFWHLNFTLTGADISEPADLGPGLLIVSPPGAAVMGKAGRNLTIMPCAGLGGEIGRFEDVGAGPGVPVLGDDVILEPHSGVLGPVRVGSRVRVPAGIGVTHDVADDMLLEGPRTRIWTRKAGAL